MLLPQPEKARVSGIQLTTRQNAPRCSCPDCLGLRKKTGWRWSTTPAFFGDSTMRRLFMTPRLKTISSPQVHKKSRWEGLECRQIIAERCGLNEFFGFQNSTKWTSPNPDRLEGSLRYGLSNPRCQDFFGCNTQLL